VKKPETKEIFKKWASSEGRTISNLVERIVLDAIATDSTAGSTQNVPNRQKQGRVRGSSVLNLDEKC
jgi:hypothetical protein